MIKLHITPNRIEMDGHAGHSVNGQDIVCSAISALTCTLVIGLEQLTGNQIRVELGSGRTIIEWQELSDTGKLLVDAWFLGITAINEQYNCITIN